MHKQIGQMIVYLELNGSKGAISVANISEPDSIVCCSGYHMPRSMAYRCFNEMKEPEHVHSFFDRGE